MSGISYFQNRKFGFGVDAGNPASQCLPLRRLEKSMRKVEYRVRPVTRYVVTRYHADDRNAGVETCGEFANESLAVRVGIALSCREDEAAIVYPPETTEAAITQLIISAEACENNAPIWEAEGNLEQAELSRRNAAAYRAAIAILAGEDEKLASGRIAPV